MVFHSFYLFDRRGACLYYEEWSRPRSTLASSPEEDRRLMFGLCFSLKQLVKRMSPTPRDEGGLRSFKCGKFVLHHFESPTGYRFVLTAPPTAGDLHSALVAVYSKIFVEWVAKNPLHAMGDRITNEAFSAALNQYFRTLPAFCSA